MTDTPDEQGWLSVYLFINAWIYTPECDQVLTRVVEPFVRRAIREGWADQHFFIRYSEHGPHVRLRLHGRMDVLRETAWPALVQHLRAGNPDLKVDEGPEQPALQPDGEPRVTHAKRVPYEPETDRYGGPHALPVAERLFQDSSNAAYALIEKMGTERSSRLGKGMLATVIACHVFVETRERASAFGKNYSTNYLRALAAEAEGRETFLDAFDQGFAQQAPTLAAYVDEIWERMDAGDKLSDTLDAYAAGLRARRDELRALTAEGRVIVAGEPTDDWNRASGAILPSYVHMMNNRLGVAIQEESYLGYLVHRAFSPPAYPG